MSDIESGKRPHLVADIGNFVKERMIAKAELVVSQFLEFTVEELEREFRGTTRNLWGAGNDDFLFVCSACDAWAPLSCDGSVVYDFNFCPYCGRRIENAFDTTPGMPEAEEGQEQ